MKITHLLLIPILLAPVACTPPNPKEVWVEEHVKYLKLTNPFTRGHLVIRREDEGVFYGGREGLIRFSDGGWAYIVSHSKHDENQEIGDITLAYDNNGNIYSNHSHICGYQRGVSIRSKSPNGFADIKDFLESKEWGEID